MKLIAFQLQIAPNVQSEIKNYKEVTLNSMEKIVMERLLKKFPKWVLYEQPTVNWLKEKKSTDVSTSVW